MKKTLPLLLLVLGACAPDITQNPAPSNNTIIVEFDPGNLAVPIVPTPNDLALDQKTGKVTVPIPQGCPNAPAPATPVPATSGNGAQDGTETDVDCGGLSGKACDAGKSCAIYEDCASGVCTAGKCVGGCPSDAQQEFNRDYLGGLSGFPFESTAQVLLSGEVDPGSVSAATVLVVDVTSGAAVPVTDATIQPAPAAINILPPPKLWLRGHHYAVAVLGGASGVKGKNGEAVVGSQTWALVSSTQPLVNCNADKSLCTPAVDIIPSAESDPQARLADQVAKATQLEQIRTLYDPLLKEIAGTGKNRGDIITLWTFSIVDAGEVTFDPSHNTIPFPNDILRDPASGKVTLPNPKTFKPLTAADCTNPTDSAVALVCGLNTLDGFSTVAPPVSENADGADAVSQATIVPASLTPASVGLAPVKPGAPAAEQTQPKWTPCLNCLSTPDATGKPQTSPQQLQWKLDVPLDEKTTYLAWMTGDIKDDKGKNVVANPVFALLRSKATLLTAEKKSAVPSLASDDQVTQLEPLRAALAPALDGLAAKGVARPNVTLAFAFTTQSTATLQTQLAQLPSNPALAFPDAPVFTSDQTAAYKAAASGGGIPTDAIGKFYVGTYLTPLAVTGPGGTLNPTAPKPEPVAFVVAVPCDVATNGAGCTSPFPAAPPAYPVAIFGHGFTRSRNDFIAIANALTKTGHIVIAPDHVWHGERTSCTGAAILLAAQLPPGTNPTDDFACTSPTSPTQPDPVNAKCDEGVPIGRCRARNDASRAACNPAGPGGQPVADATCDAAGQGRCVAADSKCEGADFFRSQNPTDFKAPVISGLKSFNPANFFETRDTFRQSTIDFAQLVRILKGTGISTAPSSAGTGGVGIGVAIATTKIDYVGQSLGGIYGALFNAVSPDTKNVALNVAGGNLTALFLGSPRLKPLRDAFITGVAATGVKIGTPAFDTLIGFAQWVLDPADPRNYGYQLTHGVSAAPDPGRHAFLQFIEGDDFVINVANFGLVTAANRTFEQTPPKFGCQPPLYCYEFTEALDNFNTTSAPISGRHGFLLAPPSVPDGLPLTVKAQTQVATFLATGAVP